VNRQRFQAHSDAPRADASRRRAVDARDAIDARRVAGMRAVARAVARRVERARGFATARGIADARAATRARGVARGTAGARRGRGTRSWDAGRARDAGRGTRDAGRVRGTSARDDGGGGVDAEGRVYDEPEVYDVAFGFRDFEKEIEFVRECARRHASYGEGGMGMDATRTVASALELGAGPAWHSVAAAKGGIQAVALEQNAAMRAHAMNKLAALGDAAPRNIRIVEGDMRDVAMAPMTKPEGGFDVALMLLGTAAHLLTHDDAMRCFKSVRENLRPGGLFIVELEHPWDLFSGEIAQGQGDAWERVDEEKGVKVYVEWGRDGDNFDIESQIYERTVSFSLVDASTEAVLKIVQEVVPCKIFTAPEMVALANAAGLEFAATYGDMDGRIALDDENAHNMIMIFRRPS
jgi:SAM-dependent methyltransferase